MPLIKFHPFAKRQKHNNKSLNFLLKSRLKKMPSGFTIVELVVVIVIIGILASISYVSYVGIVKKAQAASISSDLKKASSQLLKYKADNGEFPISQNDVNDGKGFEASQGVYFDYYANGNFCLEAHLDDITYHVTSDSIEPAEGDCGAVTFVANLSSIYGSEDWTDFRATSMVQTSDGGYAITGYYIYPGSEYPTGSMYIAKFDKAGNYLWGKCWGNMSHADRYGIYGDRGNAIVQANDGGYVITGQTASYSTNGDNDMFIAKFDSNGSFSWNKTLGIEANDDSGSSLAKTSDGGYVVTGNTCPALEDCTLFLAKYDSAGSLLWSKSGGGSSIVQTSDGGYVAISGVYIKKYNSSGDLLWDKAWTSNLSGEYGASVVQTSDGGYALTGKTAAHSNGGSDDMIFIKFDSAGNITWSRTWGGPYADSGNSIIQTGDGGYIIVGDTTYNLHMFFVKFDSMGNLSWNKTFGSGDFSCNGKAIIETSDGGYAIVGNITDGLGPMIVKLTTEGEIIGCPSSICNTIIATVSDPALTVTEATETVSTLSVTTTSEPIDDVVNLPATGGTIVSLQI